MSFLQLEDLGLDVAKVAVDHLDPNKSTSVIRKLQSELKGSSDSETQRLQTKLDQTIVALENSRNRLTQIEAEIAFAKEER